MPKATMQENRSFRPDPPPERVGQEPAQGQIGPSNVAMLPVAALADPVRALGPAGYLGSRAEIEAELDLVAAAIRAFYGKQPDQIMRECAGFSARLTELAVLLHRREGYDRNYARIRTQQVQRFLDELEHQFRTASRLVEMLRLDVEIMRGT